MKARTASRAAWSLWYLIVGLSVASFVLTLLIRSVLDPIDTVVLLGMAVAAVGYGTVGSLITAGRQNRIGWIFCTIALGFAVYALTWAYVIRGLVTAPGSLPGIAYMAWVRAWALTFAFAPIPLVFLLFPNGLLPSRRWRPVAWVLIVGPALNLLGTAFHSGVLFEQYGVRVENPFGIAGVGEDNWLAFIVPALIWFGAAISSVVALVRRFRRATGEERQQLKWLAYVAGTAAALLFPGLVLGAAGLSQFATPVSLALSLGALFIGIPVASAMAILKYRLYDLDVVVKRTVLFGVLAVLVSALYVGIVVGIGSAVKGSERSPATILTFLAAAILALLFQPIHRYANHLANRLVYGERATPYEVLSEFSDRMAGAYSTDDVLPRMTQILAAGTGARQAQVWLRVGVELRLATSWPPEEETAGRVLPLSGEELPEVPGASGVFPVRHQGELLGAITIAVPASDPLTPSKEKLIQDLAAQAGLVLRNVRLIQELRASRQRIVSTQDARAKALERNIHDGAQQQLVALMVKLRLAEGLAGSDPGRTQELLRDLQVNAGDALENLRELARGIYPPLLADKGLTDALAAQARRSPVSVDIDADGIGRYPQETEGAVYFCCLEALQNVAKYAGASQVRIRLSVELDQLVFQVVDDGTGFDTAATPYGSGLQNMADRLAALGGTVEVESQPGRGTTVRGRIPAGHLTTVT
jgi:signal transduction histidine kinase